MRRWVLILVLLLVPSGVSAQGEPRLDVELPEGDVIVGQPVTLRLKLLVPSWMPKPPVWPTLEVPSLLVRLPEKASTAVSETIEGETWSGISRAYRLYPLQTGVFEIPAQTLKVTYADPGKPDPLVSDLTLDAIRFEATLPKGAGGLDPPIVAEGLTLEQQVEGDAELVIGDAITRSVTVSIAGTTPILLPSLTPELAADSQPAPLRAYPKEPVVSETEQRGVLSGSRTETTTYVAQAGGDVELPEVTLSWFNLDSGQVETATLPATPLTITAPPPPPPGPADYARWAAIALAALGLLWGGGRWVWPRIRALIARARTAWIASESYAARAVRRAMKSGSLGDVFTALDPWSRFFAPCETRQNRALDAALAKWGSCSFAATPGADEANARREAIRAFAGLRAACRDADRLANSPGKLAPLNPQGSGLTKTQ